MIKFKFWVEKISKEGSSWDSDNISPEVLLESVTVTTKAKILRIEEMVMPITIAQGCESRIAEISGFFANSLTFDGTANSRLDVVQDDKEEALGRAISVSSGQDLIPELGNHKWRINTFTWDRQANKLGQYHFSMSLGYVWVPSENEIRLFASGVATVKYNNVKFECQKNGGSKKSIMEPTINTRCKDLNTAKFSTVYNEFAVDDLVKIYCSTDPTRPIFYGLIKEVKNAQNGTFVYWCTEIGEILNRKQCAKIGTGLFKPRIKIPNPYKRRKWTVQEMVKIILSFYHTGHLYGWDPGSGVCRAGGDIASSQTLPGRSEDLPAQILSGMTVGKALDTFLNNQCGLYTWYAADTGKLEYGYVRSKVTIDPTREYIESSEKVEASTSDYDADYVMLWSNSTGQCAKCPAEAVLPTSRCIQYKLNSDLYDSQLAAFARRIYTDTKQGRDTYRVRFQAGVVKFQDGDYFGGLGDDTTSTPMPYRSGVDANPAEDPGDEVWQIKEMTITEQYTEVIVGSSYFSIFDIYQDALKRCDGVSAPTETKNVTGMLIGIGVSGITTEET